ncbi:chemotaxis protein CheW [Magnetospirillum sulfuroxidans]|uniref:Chemotaxis protein CheW n=1 Tax=Magnetospirillum sulfuroxidans TaxID=611300 RepID=A0ABS5IH82_9PROT|nr:chemotaxis protein CheW [Magnetospirillum sulfuroxidans]
MNQIVPASKRPSTELVAPETQDYVTMFIDGQMFGIAVLTVQDVLGPQKITRIPLAPREVAGSLNLRGRIVTAIDVRLRLGLKRADEDNKGMSVVVEQGGELYSLMVDQVGEVLSLPVAKFERNPPTLDPMWREFSAGIYRLDDKLLVVLDVAKLLDFNKSE